MGELLRALIVEDDPDDAELDAAELEDAGFEVAWERVATRDAMAKALRDGEWDVVLADHVMPGFSSNEALALVREIRPSLPFIIVSGRIGEEAAVEIMRGGAWDYVSKENIGRLAPVIRRTLREAEAQRARDAAQEELRASEQRFRRIVETASEGVWTLDADGRTDFVNARMAGMLGHAADEMIGRPLPDFMDDGAWRSAEAYLERRQRGVAEHHELRFRRRDGSELWAWLAATPLLDAAGGYAGALVMVTDITDRKDAERELERHTARKAAIAELGEQALRGGSLGELFDRAAALAAEMLDARFAEVLELLPEGDELLLRAGAGWGAGEVGALRIPAHGRSYAVQALTAGEPVVCEDLGAETRFEVPQALLKRGIASCVCVPVPGRERPFGALGVHDTVARPFTADDVHCVQALAHTLADAIGRHQAEQQIRHQALHDVATGLPNRTLFLERLTHRLAGEWAPEAPVAVLIVDVDQFNLVNETLGPAAAQRLLPAFAARVRGTLAAGDTLAHFDGEQFAVLCEAAGLDDAVVLATRLTRELDRPIELDGGEQHVTVSIGIGVTDGVSEPEALLRDATAAVHHARERGGAQFELFDPAMRERSLRFSRTERELRAAIEGGQLRNAYQPIVSLHDGRVVAFESLLRWEHPERGTLAPGEFIDVAERTGLILPIGRRVLAGACAQLRRLEEQGAAPDLTMNVNLSPRQVTDPDLVEGLVEALTTAGVDPGRISLEITETVLIEDVESALEKLRELKALGVGLVLDDFGTGYSSLTHVKRFPIDMVKIDRSFVAGLGRNADDIAIVNAVVLMTRALGIDVVAEGVETAAQEMHLRALGCELAQGHRFGRPSGRAAAGPPDLANDVDQP